MMAHYLVQASYNRQAMADLVRIPEDRSVPVRAVVENLGGSLEAYYYAFGDYDVVAIIELPDNVSMAALSMAVGAGGALVTFRTTVLLTMDEAVNAMRRAGTVGYRPPGG
jgi:uncharacterized protein with GYD domain